METVGTLDISEDEILEALHIAAPTQHNEPGWFTVEELIERSGLGATTVRKRLKTLVKSGQVEYKKVARISLLGAHYHCNAFHLT